MFSCCQQLVSRANPPTDLVVEHALNKLFSTGRDDVCFGELQRALLHSGDAMSRAAIDSALEAMEAANKVMHREGRVHLI